MKQREVTKINDKKEIISPFKHFTTFDTTFTPNLSSFLPFQATTEQSAALNHIQNFLADDSDFLIVRGAAGTGKTSIMKAVADFIASKKNIDFELLAPTGRAAKNIASKTNYEASTLHSHLYLVQVDMENASVRFLPKTNKDESMMVYIVDESSMLSNRLSEDSTDYETANPLLTDLIRFVRAGHKNNKIIFVGDSCQLPPIGYNNHESPPALSVEVLTKTFNIRGTKIELSAVMRQQGNSYILHSAYEVRDCILNPNKKFTQSVGKRVYNQSQVIETYLKHFQPHNFDAVAIVSYSNKYVKECNSLIRSKLGYSGVLSKGDRLVVNQNYASHSAQVANGEIGVVVNTGRKQRIEELNFMEVEILFKDKANHDFTITTQVMLDILEAPKTVTKAKKSALFASAMRHNPTFRQSKDIRDDQFLSAMQLSYGHAFTCYKAQGSEWDTVIMNTWMPPKSDYRFLYTGITRARKELFTNNAHLI